MKTGSAVISALPELGYAVRDIVITKDGDWLVQGKVQSSDAALEGTDVVFIALHGAYGEDGQVQRILARKHIPYTGSGALASALAFNKAVTKKILEGHGVQTPKYRVLSGSSLWSVAATLDLLLVDMGEELFIKPVSNGSSNATYRIAGKEQLENAIELLLPRYGQVLIEEYIQGREVTVGVLQGFRDHAHYALPVVEIVPPHKHPFFTNEAKYSGETTYHCPADFTFTDKSRLADVAVIAHTALGCDHYSRSDFIVSGDAIYFLELNTLPGLTEHSLLPKSAHTVGLDFQSLVKHLVETARV
jgi:D-alanine-D-alanine ligase